MKASIERKNGLKTAIIVLRVLLLLSLLALIAIFLYEDKAHPTDITMAMMLLHFLAMGIALAALLVASLLVKSDASLATCLILGVVVLVPTFYTIFSLVSHMTQHFA